MMNLESEVILRQQQLLQGRILLVNPSPDGLIQALKSQAECDVWIWNYADHCSYQQKGVNSYFSVAFPREHRYNQIIIFNPKAKKRLEYVLHYACENVAEQTPIFLVGEKKAGIEGSAKVLKNYGKATKIDSARHCQLWQLFAQKPVKSLCLDDWFVSYVLPNAQQDLTIFSLAGVFSQNKLDIGTAQLLPYLSQVKSGKLADFGCGAGVIACTLAIAQPNSQIFAYDVDIFALESIQKTCQHNKIHNVISQAVRGIEDIAQDFDAIVSNPPFHQGVKTDYLVSENLCNFAQQHLNKTGELWIVANRFLNYPTLLQQYFSHCEIKADTQGFKVIYAHN